MSATRRGLHIAWLMLALLLVGGLVSCQQSGVRMTPLAESSKGPATVLADGTPYRAGPGEQYNILGRLARGAQVYILARQGEWYQVSLPSGEQAWMHVLVLQPVGDTATPAPSATASPSSASAAPSATATATLTGTLRPTRTPWPTIPPVSPSHTPTPRLPTATRTVRVLTPTPTAGTPTLMLRRIIVTGNLEALQVNRRFRWTSVGVECFDASGQWLGKVNLLRADGWYPLPIATAQIKLWIGDELGGAEWWKNWDSQAVSAAPTDITLLIARAQR